MLQMQDRIHALESQLHLYLFYDGTGLLDYASFGSGARVVPELTSETYAMAGPTIPWYRRWGQSERSADLAGLPPEFAIISDTHVGSCWPMKGRRGSLGISLARPAVVTSFTIDHVPRGMSLQYQTAPREGDLWGLLEASSLPDPTYSASATLVFSPSASIVPDTSRLHNSPYEHSQFAHLGSFAFDVGSGRPFQTFNVSQEVREQLGGIRFGTVVFVIKENWGSEDFTCLYRLRIHSDDVGVY